MDIVHTCPLGSDCEVIKDNKVHRCRWYIQMQGKDAAGKNQDKWGCAMEWLPLLLTETTGGVIRLQSAVESSRNLQDLRQQEAIRALGNGAT